LVTTATSQNLTVGTEDNKPNLTLMTLQNTETLPSADLPQPHGLVTTATSKQLTIGTEGNALYPTPTAMTLQHMEAMTCSDLPQPHYLVTTAS
jgi:hypothetical protein